MTGAAACPRCGLGHMRPAGNGRRCSQCQHYEPRPIEAPPEHGIPPVPE